MKSPRIGPKSSPLPLDPGRKNTGSSRAPASGDGWARFTRARDPVNTPPPSQKERAPEAPLPAFQTSPSPGPDAEKRVADALEQEGLRAVAALSDRNLEKASLAQRSRILGRSLGASLSFWRKLGIGKYAGLDLSALTHRVLKTAKHSDELDAMMNGVGARKVRDFARRGRNKFVFSKTLDRIRQSIKPGDWSQFGNYLEKVCAAPSSGSNRLQLLLDTAFLPEVMKSIDKAQQSVDVQLFIAEDDEVTKSVFDRLAQKAREGVRVRVILDEFGTRTNHRNIDKTMEDLRAAGVEVFLRPSPLLKDHLDHRKIWVVDGSVAFTGGMNLGKSYHHDWHDQQTRVEGPAVARLEGLFEGAWAAVSDCPSRFEVGARAKPEIDGGALTHVVHHDGGRADENIKFAYLRAIRTASESIKIASPYFTDKDVVDALCEAAKRGVEVKVMLPRENDHRFMLDAARIMYEEMLAAGVNIYEHTERMVHLKVATFDGKIATVGSSNLDARSLENNDEANLFVLDKTFTREVEDQIFAPGLKKSEHITEMPEDAPRRAYRYILRKAMDLL